MIKVHCFVSCVCEAVKKTEGADHRPYYFGVWDADFDVLENGVLTYHSKRIDHNFFTSGMKCFMASSCINGTTKSKASRKI